MDNKYDGGGNRNAMDILAQISPLLGFGGLWAAWSIYQSVSNRPDGNERMREIAGYIYEGSMAFLRREYQILAIFVVIVFLLLVLFVNWQTGIAFVSGGLCST